MHRFLVPTTAAVLSALFVAIQPAGAAEITVVAVGALRGSLAAVIPQFERITGHRVKLLTGAAGALVNRIEKGDPVDVAIVTEAQINKLESEGKVRSGSAASVGKVGIGLAASKSAAHADISSLDGFKRALLSARTIGHTDPAGGASSAIYASKLLADIDIAPEIRSKVRVFASNVKLFEALSNNTIDIGFGQMTEISAASGVVTVGPLPSSFQKYSAFEAGVVVNSKELVASTAFVQFLISPSAVAAMREKGVEIP
jgi:molybdate transport system substrate-binding protein